MVLKSKTVKRDWLLRLLVTSSLTVQIKSATQIADIDKRLAVAENTLGFIAPAAPKHTLFHKSPSDGAPMHSAMGLGLEQLLKKGN